MHSLDLFVGWPQVASQASFGVCQSGTTLSQMLRDKCVLMYSIILLHFMRIAIRRILSRQSCNNKCTAHPVFVQIDHVGQVSGVTSQRILSVAQAFS